MAVAEPNRGWYWDRRRSRNLKLLRLRGQEHLSADHIERQLEDCISKKLVCVAMEVGGVLPWPMDATLRPRGVPQLFFALLLSNHDANAPSIVDSHQHSLPTRSQHHVDRPPLCNVLLLLHFEQGCVQSQGLLFLAFLLIMFSAKFVAPVSMMIKCMLLNVVRVKDSADLVFVPPALSPRHVAPPTLPCNTSRPAVQSSMGR
mmetsp:Transcript_34387/g.78369  ORF Transcript_34387/g.78369 Transcript_34387/m.78369 type:complete len:202 (-) Transcript_34387:35-640(-)